MAPNLLATSVLLKNCMTPSEAPRILRNNRIIRNSISEAAPLRHAERVGFTYPGRTHARCAIGTSDMPNHPPLSRHSPGADWYLYPQPSGRRSRRLFG